jgi:integrase
VSITARRLSNGRAVYDVRLRDPAGRVYTRTFRTKRDAETYRARELADRSRGIWLNPLHAATPFCELARSWLSANPAKRPSAWARDEVIVRLHLLPELGDRPIASIAPADVQRLIAAWSARQAPRTVRRQYGVLRAIFRMAVDADLLLRSPCRGIKLPAAAHVDRHIVTADELAALSEALGPDYGPLAYLGAVLGLRWGECAGLRVGRLDFLRSTLSVAEQLSRGPHGARVGGPPKSQAGRRTLTVPEPLMAMLAELLPRRTLTGTDREVFVFVGPDGGPLEYSNFRRRVWMPACQAAGLPGLVFHDLRRANATGLVAEGVDLKTAQTRLGHSDPRLTLAVYAQATTEADQLAADRLGVRFMRSARPARESRAMDARWPRPGRESGASGETPDLRSYQSGRRDLNPRPQRPERSPGSFRRCRSGHCSDLNMLVRGTFSVAASDRP